MQEKHKAILVVSFGTTVPKTRFANIDALEAEIQATFPEWTVRRAFTSPTVRRRLVEREGLKIDTPQTALDRLANDGFREVVVQPTHIIPGDEFDRIVAAMEPFQRAGAFASLKLGRPLLFYEGNLSGQTDDFQMAVTAFETQLPRFIPSESGRIILMGHGSGHAADRCYDLLQERIEAAGVPAFTATVEGSRTIGDAIDWLKTQEVRRVALVPFMLVAGDHAVNDMAGNEADSWQNQLQAAGYTVEVILQGLGENSAVRSLYLQHVREAKPFGRANSWEFDRNR
jgi:sirohydrochlorin cobaltochelatase